MSDSAILQALADFPPCEGMPEHLIEQLAEIARLVKYRPKDVVAGAEDRVRGIHVVRSGAVLLERHNIDGVGGHVAHLLRSGQSFGEVPVLTMMEKYTFDAVATEYGTEIVEIAADPFRNLFEGERDVPAFMVGSLSSKVIMLAQRIEQLSVISAGPRLAHYLLQQAQADDTTQIELSMDRKDLAAVLAITPEHLSRLLRRWADAGLIRPQGRTITLIQPETLRAIVGPSDAHEDVA